MVGNARSRSGLHCAHRSPDSCRKSGASPLEPCQAARVKPHRLLTFASCRWKWPAIDVEKSCRDAAVA